MKIHSRRCIGTAAFLLLLFLPGTLMAHPDHDGAHGFLHGLEHPLTGLDHLLVMVAIGLWAVQIGGRAVWSVPLAFLGVMALGGILGMAGVAVPFMEGGILLSVFLIGVLLAAALRPPLAIGMLVAGLFAFFHGNAHGVEMPANAGGFVYAIGFLIATAFLHAVGIGLGLGLGKISSPVLVRALGGLVALSAVWLWID